jgi:hypothetical protein
VISFWWVCLRSPPGLKGTECIAAASSATAADCRLQWGGAGAARLHARRTGLLLQATADAAALQARFRLRRCSSAAATCCLWCHQVCCCCSCCCQLCCSGCYWTPHRRRLVSLARPGDPQPWQPFVQPFQQHASLADRLQAGQVGDEASRCGEVTRQSGSSTSSGGKLTESPHTSNQQAYEASDQSVHTYHALQHCHRQGRRMKCLSLITNSHTPGLRCSRNARSCPPAAAPRLCPRCCCCCCCCAPAP